MLKKIHKMFQDSWVNFNSNLRSSVQSFSGLTLQLAHGHCKSTAEYCIYNVKTNKNTRMHLA